VTTEADIQSRFLEDMSGEIKEVLQWYASGQSRVRRFVKEARRAVQKIGWQVHEDGISPTLVGATPLPFPVPDSFEAAFDYRGNLRFLQFGYAAAFHQFGYSDGGDDLPSNASLWSWFLPPRNGSPAPARNPIFHPVWEVSFPEANGPRLNRSLGGELTCRPVIACGWIGEIAGHTSRNGTKP
jgi:hypothetical protein